MYKNIIAQRLIKKTVVRRLGIYALIQNPNDGFEITISSRRFLLKKQDNGGRGKVALL